MLADDVKVVEPSVPSDVRVAINRPESVSLASHPAGADSVAVVLVVSPKTTSKSPDALLDGIVIASVVWFDVVAAVAVAIDLGLNGARSCFESTSRSPNKHAIDGRAYLPKLDDCVSSQSQRRRSASDPSNSTRAKS